MSFIPKLIHLTHYDYDCIPEKVWANLRRFASDYDINFYSDQECFNFIKQHFNFNIANIFVRLSTGAHKADLFRYCIMYILGGIYLDIKVVPFKNLNTIFNHQKSNIMYTVLDHNRKGIFQGIIASYPKNIFFKELIDDFLNLDQDFFTINMSLKFKKYYTFCIKFLNNIKNKINSKIKDGEQYYSDQIIYLFQETNRRVNNETKDRYGGYFNIFDNYGYRIFKMRYNDYPWPKIKNNIIVLGNSKKNVKTIILNQNQLPKFNLYFFSKYQDTFQMGIIDNNIVITRTDLPTGWNQILIAELYKHKIRIGNSLENTKIIEFDYNYPTNTELLFLDNHKYPYTFSYIFLENNKLMITRTDLKLGWNEDLIAYVKLESIKIGSSHSSKKIINLHKNYSPSTKLCFIHNYQDQFGYEFKNKELIINRIDKNMGWNQFLIGYIVQ